MYSLKNKHVNKDLLNYAKIIISSEYLQYIYITNNTSLSNFH